MASVAHVLAMWLAGKEPRHFGSQLATKFEISGARVFLADELEADAGAEIVVAYVGPPKKAGGYQADIY